MLARKTSLLLATIFLLALWFSLLRSMFLARQAYQKVDQQKWELEELRQEVAELELQVQEASSSFELERRVREELGRQKPGETVIDLSP